MKELYIVCIIGFVLFVVMIFAHMKISSESDKASEDAYEKWKEKHKDE